VLCGDIFGDILNNCGLESKLETVYLLEIEYWPPTKNVYAITSIVNKRRLILQADLKKYHVEQEPIGTITRGSFLNRYII